MSGNIFKKKWGTGEVTVDGQTIQELTEKEADRFLNGVGIVTSQILSGSLVTGIKKWFIVANYKLVAINKYELSQARYADGVWEQREGTYFQDVENGGEWSYTWGAWYDPKPNIDLSGYAEKASTLSGYGIEDAYTKEETIKEIERLISLIPDKQGEVIQQLSESDLETFTSGYAVVTSSETTDSEGGPILTEYQWPVVAEYSDTFGSISVTQTRFYNGKLERRVGTGSESSVAWGQWVAINTAALEYKWSLESTDSLPGDNSKGDMYNIEKESDITIKVQKTKHLIPCSGSTDLFGELTASYDETYDSWLNQDDHIELFDMVGNSLAVGDIVNRGVGWAVIQGTGLEEGTQVYYIQLQNQSDNKDAQGDSVSLYETKTINIKPNQKVFYDGRDWDVFSDLSNYAEKATTLAGYGIEDAYTKEEVNSKISSVYRYKGTVDNYQSLPDEDLTVGDVYNIETACEAPVVTTEYAIEAVLDSKSADSFQGNPIYTYQFNVNSNYSHVTDKMSFYVYVPCDDLADTYEKKSVTFNASYIETVQGAEDISLLTLEKWDDGFEEYASQEGITLFFQTVGDETDPTKGTAINVIDDKTKINAGDNVAWNGDSWDVLAGTVDLSQYALKTEMPTKLSQLTNDANYSKFSGSYDDLLDKPEIKVGVVYPTETTIEIQPNTMYIFGEAASLTITLADPSDEGHLNEYMFEFTSGSTATALTVPDTVKWASDLNIEANKIYQVSIVNNIGIIMGVSYELV